MQRFSCNLENRKDLVRRVEELTGVSSKFTRLPRCAYKIGCCYVEKDGSLTVEDDSMCESMIAALQAEGIIGTENLGQAGPAVFRHKDPNLAEAPLVRPVTELWEPNTSDTTASNNGAHVWEIPTIVIPEPMRKGRISQIRETIQTFAEMPEEKTMELPEKEYLSDDLTEQETVIETPEDRDEEEIAHEPGFPMDAEFCFPLHGQTAISLINWVNTIYSRGALLTKATGGRFSCDFAFVEALGNQSSFCRAEQFLEYLRTYESENGDCIHGIRFDDEKLIVDGFICVPDSGHLESFRNLAEKINQMCCTQHCVQAKRVDDSNERYALRTWLNRIGMDGLDYKQTRKHLMENLSGHTAFRTDVDTEKARKKQMLSGSRMNGRKA